MKRIMLDLKTWRCSSPKRWCFGDEEWSWSCCRCV